jgi:hypothetical protein
MVVCSEREKKRHSEEQAKAGLEKRTEMPEETFAAVGKQYLAYFGDGCTAVSVAAPVLEQRGFVRVLRRRRRLPSRRVRQAIDGALGGLPLKQL